MPIEVRLISVNQFCELMGIEDSKRLIGVRDHKLLMKGEIALLLEASDDADDRDIPAASR